MEKEIEDMVRRTIENKRIKLKLLVREIGLELLVGEDRFRPSGISGYF